jgi:hypothetical protein
VRRRDREAAIERRLWSGSVWPRYGDSAGREPAGNKGSDVRRILRRRMILSARASRVAPLQKRHGFEAFRQRGGGRFFRDRFVLTRRNRLNRLNFTVLRRSFDRAERRLHSERPRPV